MKIKRRGFIAGIGAAAVGLLTSRTAKTETKSVVEVISNELKTLDGKPLREIHLKVPFAKTFFTVDCKTGRRVMLTTCQDKITGSWESFVTAMWENANKGLESTELTTPQESWCAIRMLVDAPDGQQQMVAILPHDITFESIRVHAPMSFLV
jgi:hypothetical protein